MPLQMRLNHLSLKPTEREYCKVEIFSLTSPPKLTALVESSLTLLLNRGYQKVAAVKGSV